MLPLHRNDGREPKRRLAYADFYRMQTVAKNKLSRGQNGRVSRVSGNKTFFFFFFFFFLALITPCFEVMKKSATVVHMFEFCLLPWRLRIL